MVGAPSNEPGTVLARVGAWSGRRTAPRSAARNLNVAHFEATRTADMDTTLVIYLTEKDLCETLESLEYGVLVFPRNVVEKVS